MSQRMLGSTGPCQTRGQPVRLPFFSLFIDFAALELLELLLPVPPALPRVASSSFGKGEDME
jgi:hypothetical protein